MLPPSLRFLDPEPAAKPAKQRCKICDNATKANKPWCSEHIEHSPYAQWIDRRLNELDNEIADILKHKNSQLVKEDSLLLQEIVKQLHYKGSKTIRGLARDLSLDHEVVEVCVRYLVTCNSAELRLTGKKDDFFVDLTIVPQFSSPAFSRE